MKYLVHSGRFIPLQETYSADSVIGATFYALKPVPIVTYPGGSPVKIVAPGQMVGVVDSYLQREDGLYWKFYNNTFAKHAEGLFDTKQLQVQTDAWGNPVKSEEEKREEEKNAAMPWYEKGIAALKYPAIFTAAAILLNSLIRSSGGSNSNR